MAVVAMLVFVAAYILIATERVPKSRALLLADLSGGGSVPARRPVKAGRWTASANRRQRIRATCSGARMRDMVVDWTESSASRSCRSRPHPRDPFRHHHLRPRRGTRHPQRARHCRTPNSSSPTNRISVGRHGADVSGTAPPPVRVRHLRMANKAITLRSTCFRSCDRKRRRSVVIVRAALPSSSATCLVQRGIRHGRVSDTTSVEVTFSPAPDLL